MATLTYYRFNRVFSAVYQQSNISLYLISMVQIFIAHKHHINEELTQIIKQSDTNRMCTIRIVNSNIQKHALQTISKCSWHNLNIITLNGDFVGDCGLKLLIQNEYPVLKKLRMRHNKITNKGLHYLAKADMPQLSELDVCLNHINSISALKRAKFIHLKKFMIRCFHQHDMHLNLLQVMQLVGFNWKLQSCLCPNNDWSEWQKQSLKWILNQAYNSNCCIQL